VSLRLKHVAGLLLLLGFCMGAQQSFQGQQASLPAGYANIADLKGEVLLHSPKGEILAAQRGLVLEAESTIETGKGSVLLNLQDGSEVLIKPHSRVVLESPEMGRGLYLELFIGKIIARVQKRLGNTPIFRMGTPSAVITVRGTRFSVEVTRKKRTYVQVFEGVVEVQGLLSGSAPVLVRPDFSTDVEENRGAQEPRSQRFDERMGNRVGQEVEPPDHQETKSRSEEGGRPD